MKKIFIIIYLFVSIIAALSFEISRIDHPVPDSYKITREKIFSEVSVTLSDNIEDNDLVHVLMETWLDNEIIMLVVKKDGTAKVYYSSGRMITNSVWTEKQKEKCFKFFNDAEDALHFSPKTRYPFKELPVHGVSIFYFFSVNRFYRSSINHDYIKHSGEKDKKGVWPDRGAKLLKLNNSAMECIAEIVKSEG